MNDVFGFGVDFARVVKEYSQKGSKDSDPDEATDAVKKTVMETRSLIGNPDPFRAGKPQLERLPKLIYVKDGNRRNQK